MIFQIALIGCGSIAHVYADAVLGETNRAHLLAIADTKPNTLATFAARYNVANAYSSLSALLERHQPNLIIIATPPATHAALIEQALRAGAHVWCEKPLVASLAQLDRVQALVDETNLTCTSVFQWRFGSAGVHIKKQIQEGAFGRPLLGICHTLWHRLPAYYAVPWRGKWETELGGVGMNLGIHAMDFFLWLLGEWAEVNTMMTTLERDIEVENVMVATLRFRNGMLGSIVNSAVSPRQTSYIRLDFAKTTVELEHLYEHSDEHWRVHLPQETFDDQHAEWNAFPNTQPASQATQFAYLLDALERGETPSPSAADVRPTLDLVASLYKSAMTGQAVQANSIQPGDPFYDAMSGITLT